MDESSNVGRSLRQHAMVREFDDRMARGFMLAPAGANVVMQLARRGVGRGVAESRVASGSLTRHPLKRTRTTLTYIWIALYGTDDERVILRRGVDAQHRHVRSHPGDEVDYDAFDASLQLWVAACMYVGSRQGYEMLYGEVSDEVKDALLDRCARFATTLQVPMGQWPADRAAFERYWQSSLRRVEFDEVTSRYISDFIDLRFAPRAVALLARRAHRLMCVGFLEESFRTALSLEWGPRDQRRFERSCAVMRRVNSLAPRMVLEFPWNLVRYDARRRLARGRSLV